MSLETLETLEASSLMNPCSLLRFLKSLTKLLSLSLRPRDALGGLPRSNTPSWAQAQVEQALKDLGAHTDCKSAVWSAAIRSFQVVRHSDHAKKEFVVKGLKRKWEEAQDRNADAKIQDAFDKVMLSAMSLLREEIAAPDAAPLAAPVADAQGEDL